MNHASTNRIPTDDDRSTLFRALTAWTGNHVAADDLVQQTMIEAWKSDRQPESRDEWRPWLFGIARNVMLRWRRDLARDLRRSIAEPQSAAILEAAATVTDIDSDLEQQEIVTLLHDVLDELPTETRRILLMKYINELPQAEIAGHLGIHEKALEGRLHRGKQKLRTHLLTYKPDTAVSLGVVTEPNTWQQTDIWCTTCGMQRLEGRWYENGGLQLDCPACSNGWHKQGQRTHEISGQLDKRYVPNRPSFRKAMSAIHAVNDDGLAAGRDGSFHCPNCTGTVRPRAVPADPHEASNSNNAEFDLCYACENCDSVFLWRYLPGSGIYTTAGKRFEQQQSRVRMLKPHKEYFQGRPTIRSTWEAIDGTAQFLSWYDLVTWKLLDTQERPK